MQKITIFLKKLTVIFALLVTINCCIAQTDSTPETSKSFTLVTELMAGPTISMAYGKYAAYQRSFGNVSYPDAKINSSLLPRIFGSVGGQVRVNFATIPAIKDFDFSVGMHYYLRGFSNHYKSTFSTEGLSLKDKTSFKEKYNLNYIAIPFKVRYTKKWFYEMGFSIDQLVFARRKHVLKRAAKGSDAYDEGYRKTERTSNGFSDSLLKNRVIGYDLAVGKTLSEKLDCRINFHFARPPFETGEELKNLVTHFDLLFKL